MRDHIYLLFKDLLTVVLSGMFEVRKRSASGMYVILEIIMLPTIEKLLDSFPLN